MNLQEKQIAVIGLGYLGPPLAIEFGKKYKVLGFDIKIERIDELNSGRDRTNEADLEGLSYALEFSLGLNVIPNDKYSIDKSLVNTRNNFGFKVKSYEAMINEMHSWILMNKELYPHYRDKLF